MFSLQKNVDCIVSFIDPRVTACIWRTRYYGYSVVATRYSGNLTFMPDDHPGLVDYDLVNVGQGAAPYSPDAVWAEPCLDSAARAMRRNC